MQIPPFSFTCSLFSAQVPAEVVLLLVAHFTGVI